MTSIFSLIFGCSFLMQTYDSVLLKVTILSALILWFSRSISLLRFNKITLTGTKISVNSLFGFGKSREYLLSDFDAIRIYREKKGLGLRNTNITFYVNNGLAFEITKNVYANFQLLHNHVSKEIGTLPVDQFRMIDSIKVTFGLHKMIKP